MKGQFHLRLPATSANLGPAFDTAAVALRMHLDIRAEPAEEFSVSAEGRDAAVCGKLDGNLVLATYRKILSTNGRAVVPLRVCVANKIPLGMGCGSSAAARLAGIALAVQFGQLDWGQDQVLDVATALEGHPDNVSACWLGGMTVSAVSASASGQSAVDARLRPGLRPINVARLDVPRHWRPVLVLPRTSLGTEESRKVLPDHYSRADAVANLQHTALLVAAFGSANSDLLRAAMHDRLHQPYRRAICPILNALQGMTLEEGVLGVALSGAGPGVLLILEDVLKTAGLLAMLEAKLGGLQDVEVMECAFENRGAMGMVDTFSSPADRSNSE